MMRKMIFGCTLILYGAICGSGWLNAYANIVQSGAWSTMFMILNRPDGYIVLFFYLISIVGTVIVVKALKDEL